MNRNSLLIGVGVVAIVLCAGNFVYFHSISALHLGTTDTLELENMARELLAAKTALGKEKNRTKALEMSLLNQQKAMAVEKQQLETRLKDTHFKGAGNEPGIGLTSASDASEGVCSLLPIPVPSTMALWSSMLGKVIESTKHFRDSDKFMLHDFYAQILHMMPPDRLQRSVKSLPHDWTSTKRVMDVAYNRWMFVKNQSTTTGEEPRRLKILVMGGSVMVGVQCRKMPFSYRMPRKECVWTYRLQSFLNNMLGGDVVETHNIAMGGTNSETGYTIWKYELLPDEMQNPDIIINAYSTNDMHILTVLDAEKSNQTLGDRVLDIVQQFVRSVMNPCNKRNQPLYIHMDDYLGNEQREILETTKLSQSVSVLASYYGFPFISYADVLRDIVYGDTRETWFSPAGWYSTQTGKFEREIHPGMAMHILSTWLVSYNLLNLVTSYCSITWALPDENATSASEIKYRAMNGLPQLIHGNRWVPDGKPRPRPEGLPPPLTKDLMLDQVSDLWRNSSLTSEAASDCSSTSTGRRCAFSWVSGLTKMKPNETDVTDSWMNHLTENEGWSFQKDHNKLGFVPEGLGSNFIMEFSNITQPIRMLTLMVMKSYGERWEKSRIKVDTSARQESGWTDLKTTEFVGFHNKNTSESYTHEIGFENGIAEGSSLRVGVELVGGTTFKLLGLVLCS